MQTQGDIEQSMCVESLHKFEKIYRPEAYNSPSMSEIQDQCGQAYAIIRGIEQGDQQSTRNLLSISVQSDS